MAGHSLARMAVALLGVWVAMAHARADDISFQYFGEGPAAGGAVGQDVGPSRPPADSRYGIGFDQPPSGLRRPLPAGELPTRPVGQPRPNGWAAEPDHVTSWEFPVRLPSTGPARPALEPLSAAASASVQPIVGTWHEDGDYLILNLNGQEVRLAKTASASGPAAGALGQTELTGGTVLGRLLDQAAPLANCQVALIPLTRGLTGYRLNRHGQSSSVTTDPQGVYRFENVPPAAYKLTWLPQGQNQWIRRLSLRPDVVVKAQETTGVKDIRTALRTVN